MRYDPRLDGLRAIAALIVVAFHAKSPLSAGGVLVDIFFVLSGYLISRILLDEKRKTNEIDYGRFFTRRLWRLYPALLLLIAAYALMAPILYPQYENEKHYLDIILSSLYLADYARTLNIPLSVLNHTWSLSVEMHFYLIWPFVLALVLKLPADRVPVAFLLLWAAATLWRWYSFYSLEDGWDIYNRADTHSSGLILGAFIATIKPTPGKLFSVLGFAGIIIAITMFSWRSEATALVGFSLAELGTAMVILAAPAWLGAGVLPWIGKMSYGLYLWHYPVIRVMRNIDAGWQASLLAGVLLGLLLASASYYLVEQPILKRRRTRLQNAGAASLGQGALTRGGHAG